ncbi:MAG: glycosyltransferase [Protaetiibacter sp.]
MPSVAIIGTRGYPSYYGGFETAVRHLAPFLADRGWDTTVYGRPGATSPNPDDADARVTRVLTRGIERKSLSTLSYGLTSVLDARRRRPDVALVMNVANGFWLPLLRRAGIPTVVNVDGIEWERAKWGGLARGVFRLGARRTARFADQLIFDSREIERRWGEGFARTGAFIPYGGTPADSLAPPPLGLPSGGYVLLVARFVPENTIGEFLDAVPLLAESTEVVLVGSTGYGGELDVRARRLDARHASVRWLGHVSDDALLHALWQHCGVYFHGHSAGGTNPALVQAMALGAPVVARDTPYNREVLGELGAFVGADPSDIVRVVRDVLGRDQRDLPSRLRARAAAQYGWREVCEAYEREMKALLGVEEKGGHAGHRASLARRAPRRAGPVGS